MPGWRTARRRAMGRGHRAGMEEAMVPGWRRSPRRGGAVGEEAAPRWGRPPRRGRQRGGGHRTGVEKQAAGRPVLRPPCADPAEGGRLRRPEPHPRAAACGSGRGRSPSPPRAPSSGRHAWIRRDERGGDGADPAPSSGLITWGRRWDERDGGGGCEGVGGIGWKTKGVGFGVEGAVSAPSHREIDGPSG
jgi:hypothetical protein